MQYDFLVVCLNPTFQKTIVLDNLIENEVNRSSEYTMNASGKGVNVTRVLTQLGTRPIHLTQSGDRGEYFARLCTADNLNIITAANTSYIRTCSTLINRNRNTVTEIVEESPAVDEGTEKEIIDLYMELLGKTENIIIAGSKASGFGDFVFPEMVKAAKSAGKTVILDYRGKDLVNSIPFKPDIIKINFPEFVSTFFPEYTIGEHEENPELEQQVKERIYSLYRESGIKTILTRGTMPVIYIDNAGTIRKEIIPGTNTINTIGSGDAFTAGLAYSLNKGPELENGVKFGIECGSKNAALLKPGVIT